MTTTDDFERLHANRFFQDLPVRTKVFVSVYDMVLSYGGPEEGGWWYDHFSFVKAFPVLNVDEIVRAKIDALAKKFPPDADYFSVNGGRSFAILAEGTKASFATKQRPQYE